MRRLAAILVGRVRRKLAEEPRGEWLALGFLVVCAVAAFVYIRSEYPHTPAISGDSRSYVSFSWYRAPGVGLFARGARALTGGLGSVVTAQLGLGLAAAVFFAWTLGRVLESRKVAVALGVLLIFSGTSRAFDIALISESLFLSFSLASVALALRHWQRGGTWFLAAASLCASLAMLARPTGAALIAPLLLCALGRSTRNWRALAIGFAPWILVCLVWSVANYQRFARATPLLRGGEMLFAATAQYLTPDLRSLDDPIVERHAALVSSLAKELVTLRAALKDLERKSPSEREAGKHALMLKVFYGRGELGGIKKKIARYFKQNGKRLCPVPTGAKGPHLPSCIDRELGALARVGTALHRGTYLANVWESWTLYADTTHETYSFDGSRYHRKQGAVAEWWRKIPGIELPVRRENYPVLSSPPLAFQAWRQITQARLGGRSDLRIGDALGRLDRWLCLAVLAWFAAETVRSSIRQRWLVLPTNRPLFVAGVLYAFYALHHLSGALVHPAIQRYTMIMAPFAIAALSCLLVLLPELGPRWTTFRTRFKRR